MARKFIPIIRQLRSRAKSKGNWVAVMLSFLMAVTLWFLVTLNQPVSYQADLSYPLKITNLPDTLEFVSPPPSRITLFLEGSGSELLFEQMKMFRDTLIMDFSAVRSQGSVNQTDMASIFSYQVRPGVRINGTNPSVINLNITSRAGKWVPVIRGFNLETEDAWKVTSDPEYDPDSVLIIGPESQLVNIYSWKTQAVDLHVNDEINVFEVPLDTLKGFEVHPAIVKVILNADLVTESRKRILLTKLNLPLGKQLKLDPPEVEVTYLVPVDKYETIMAQDFTITVDYDQIEPESDFLVPRISEAPEDVEILKISPLKINFVVVNEIQP